MDFEDTTLLHLANASTRRGVFDDLALEHILDAAFVTSDLGVQGPFDATFEEIHFGTFAPAKVRVDGAWAGLGGVDRIESVFEAGVPCFGQVPRIDAIWRGTVIARAALAVSTVQAVTTVWPELDSIDEDIVPLPTDPVALETARREAFRARLRANAAAPDAVGDGLIDKLLAQAGVASVGDLARRHRGEQATGQVRITFADPGQPQSTPRSFPVAVAVLVRDATHRLVDLLAESKAIQWLLTPHAERARDQKLAARHPVVVAWILPAATFDDPDWPGAETGMPVAAARLARRAGAAQWLALEGIALVAFETPAELT